MKCIMCSKETNSDNQLCDKCDKKLKKEEEKQAKARLKQSKFQQVDYDHDPEYGRMVYTTGMRSSIISLVSAITAVIFSVFIVPGFIFGLLALVEGIITLVDVIRNNRRGHKRMLPLAFAIIGLCGAGLSFIISMLSIISIIVFLTTGTAILFLGIFKNLFF